MSNGALDGAAPTFQFTNELLHADETIFVINDLAEQGRQLSGELFQDQRVQVPPDDTLVIEAEDRRADHAADHVGGLVVVVAIVTAMLSEGADERDALGSPGAATTLSIV